MKEDYFVPRQTKIVEIAEMLADESAEQDGFKKGGKKWLSIKEQYLNEYLGELSANISAKKMKNPILKNPSMSEVSKDIFKNEFKEKRILSLVSQISNYFFETILGKKVRGRIGDNQTFVSFPKSPSTLEARQVYINRYKKDMYNAMVTAMLVKAFSIEEKDMDDLLRKLDIENTTTKDLAKRDVREKYSKAIYAFFHHRIKDINLFDKSVNNQ